ncbi:unnamed protein product, partial [Staurois parvus]
EWRSVEGLAEGVEDTDGGQWRDWQTLVEDTEWRSDGLIGREGWRTLNWRSDGEVQRGRGHWEAGGIGREGWQIQNG